MHNLENVCAKNQVNFEATKYHMYIILTLFAHFTCWQPANLTVFALFYLSLQKVVSRENAFHLPLTVAIRVGVVLLELLKVAQG